MYELLGQLVFVVANNDGRETPWQQLLVLVIIVVFWALGGIVKARTGKAERNKEEQQQPPQRRLRPAPKQRPRPQQIRQRRLELARPQQAKPKPQPVQAEVERIIPEGLEQPKKPRAEKIVDFLPSLEDPDELASAILYYEILGKPLALREPQGTFSGF